MIPLPKPMSANDVIVLDAIFDRKKAELDPKATNAAFWEFFTAEQILREHPFDLSDTKFGIVGQESNKSLPGTDGGIDAIYLVANGRLIRDTQQAKLLSEHKGETKFDIIIIQSTKTPGFDLATLIRLINTSQSIFDIGKQPSAFTERYNERLLNIINCFRDAHTALLTSEHKISVHFFIATYGDALTIDNNIKGKAAELETTVRRLLATIASCKVEFLGARDIITKFNRPRKIVFPMKCVSSITDNNGGYVALVKIEDFYSLIAEKGQIRDNLFESNVRDYEGEVRVNKQIKDTLQQSTGGIDFWWLNNGITIIAEKVIGPSPELVLHDPQIVNGLQTSKCIFDCLSQPTFHSASDARHIIIRIVRSQNAEVQDKIIRATNSQTKIPAQYLWAHESRQRDIADMFHAKGLCYERKKNSWRKSQRPLEDIISPSELAQNVAAVLLQEPDQARGRPSRYSDPQHRKQIFKPGIPLPVYVVCSLLRRRTEAFLEVKESDGTHRNNLLFYVMMAMRPLLLVPDADGKVMRLQDIDVSAIANSVFEKALSIVRPIYDKYGASDKAAKGTEMVSELKTAIANMALPVKRRRRTRRTTT